MYIFSHKKQTNWHTALCHQMFPWAIWGFGFDLWPLDLSVMFFSEHKKQLDL